MIMVRMGANMQKTVTEENQPSTSRSLQTNRSRASPVDLFDDSNDDMSSKASDGDPLFGTPNSGIRSTRSSRMSCISPRRSSPRKRAAISYDSSSDDSSEDGITVVRLQKATNNSLSCAQSATSTPAKRLLGCKPFGVTSHTTPTRIESGKAWSSSEKTQPILPIKLPRRIIESDSSKEVTPQPGPSGLSNAKPMCKKTISRPQSIASVIVAANGKKNDGSSTSSVAGSASALINTRKRPPPRAKTTKQKDKSPETMSLIPQYLGSYPTEKPTPTITQFGEERNRTKVFTDFVTQMLRNDERLNPALYNWKVKVITQTLMENEIPEGPRP